MSRAGTTLGIQIASQTVYVPELAVGECCPWYGGSYKLGSGGYVIVAVFDSPSVIAEDVSVTCHRDGSGPKRTVSITMSSRSSRIRAM